MSVDNLQLESGDNFLLENGDFLLLEIQPVPGSSGGGTGRYHYLPPADYGACRQEIKALEKERVLVERRIARLEKKVDSTHEKAQYEASMVVLNALVAQLTRTQEQIAALYVRLTEIEDEEMMILSICINDAEWQH